MSSSNYINDEFTTTIKQWIDVDTQIQTLNEDLKKLRETRNARGAFITKYIEANNLTKTKFSLTNGYIKYSKTNQSGPLTFKYILECLKQYFKDEELATNVCEFIKTNRQTTLTTSIKRYIKSP